MAADASGVSASSSLAATATFNPYSGDGWRARRQIMNRFVDAARTIVVRARVERRLEGLMDKVTAGGGTMSSRPSTAASSMRSRGSLAGAVKEFGMSCVAEAPFPSYKPANFKDRKEVTPSVAPEFVDWDTVDLVVPQMWKTH